MTEQPKFTAKDVGVYLDGAFGWHNTYRVVDLAVSVGYPLSDDDRQYVDAFRNQRQSMVSPLSGDEIGAPEIAEAADEIAQEVTYWLDSVTAPGLWWEWYAGELALCSDESEEQQS